MKTKAINLKKHWDQKVADNNFSFAPFLQAIKNRIGDEQTIKADFYRYVINKCEKYPELFDPGTHIADLDKYGDILELVYLLLTPATANENSFYWAISTPVPFRILYSTNALFDFINEYNKQRAEGKKGHSLLLKQTQVDFMYKLILQKLYDFPADLSNDIVYSYIDDRSGLCKYYRIAVNQEYIQITYQGDLPKLNPEIIEPCIYEGVGMEILKETIPLDMFKFSGFSIITITEITSENAIENIRSALVNHTGNKKRQFDEIARSLQILAGNQNIQFGLLPFIRINNEIETDSEECRNSLIIKTAKRYRVSAGVIHDFIKQYHQAPASMFFSTINDRRIEKYPFLSLINKAGIKSYAILPVYYNKHLAGIIEIFSAKKIIFYEKLLMSLQSGIPFISQLFKDTIDNSHQQIEKVIKEQFTILQPSVEWKFNRAAWNHIKSSRRKNVDDIETVYFEKVYPLYGAIDIRNSTLSYNEAFDEDLIFLSKLLKETVQQLKNAVPQEKHAELNENYKTWVEALKELRDETMFKTYLYDTVGPYLKDLKKCCPETEPLLKTYYENVDEQRGMAYSRRNELEQCIKKINSTLGNYFEKQLNILQEIFPCYFEKFRSDGVEYDLYVGQSLTDEKPFTSVTLKRFREWQVRSMIEIANITNKLAQTLPKQLQTTSLIFVHSGQIDICFRNDERRFDVEGYYNVRYEVIKKRIDKATIKNSGERLTQPGKIAIVYFNRDDITTYLKYIKRCQGYGSLLDDLEEVELDDLQGVRNIKALRVGVNYQHTLAKKKRNKAEQNT